MPVKGYDRVPELGELEADVSWVKCEAGSASFPHTTGLGPTLIWLHNPLYGAVATQSSTPGFLSGSHTLSIGPPKHPWWTRPITLGTLRKCNLVLNVARSLTCRFAG